MRPTGFDMFAGAGGLSLGFEQAGFDVVGALEIDPIHCATHEYNFPDCKIFCSDASRITGKEILSKMELRAGEIDVVFGGPPCQGFSMIGKRLSDDPRNQLLSHFLRIVEELYPPYFVMENVSGLSLGHSKSVLDAFLKQADEMGYETVAPVRVLNAANFGVPQDRRRIIVLGYRTGLPAPSYPEFLTAPRTKDGSRHPKADDRLPLGPSVREAISDLPDIDDFDELLDSDSVPHRLRGGSAYARRLRNDEQDASDYSYHRVFDRRILTSSARAEHTALSRRRFKATRQGAVEPISRFYRLPLDGISNTLRAGTPSNRGAFTSPRPIHPDYSRCISVREAARLHSYPDWFRFHVTKWHGFRQIGNSVPPLLGRAVAASIMKAMGGNASKPKTPITLAYENLLRMDMTDAAEKYGVSKHVIEPRVRQAK